ncbi:MAG: polysaccharide biosynthesis/export family protein [Salinivirgaceae bacterium]
MKKLLQKNNLILVSFVLLALSGCKYLNPSVMFDTPSKYDYSSFEQEKNEYVIRPFDKLNVRIFTNDGIQLIDMESNNTASKNSVGQDPYLVEYDGLVKVPTLGRVSVAGLTIKESEKLLEEKYAQFYQKPFVLVNVTNRRVVVFTSGSTKGEVLNIDNEKFTLIEALAQAGGIDDFSKAYQIKLLRGNLDNPQVYKFNISSIEEMKKANMVLQANDIIYVDKRARYASRTLNELMPVITLLNTFFLLYLTIQAL